MSNSRLFQNINWNRIRMSHMQEGLDLIGNSTPKNFGEEMVVGNGFEVCKDTVLMREKCVHIF